MIAERRHEPRMLCADLVDVDWTADRGLTGRLVANLEDISPSGACIQVDHPIPLKANVRITHAAGELSGVVRYCVFREIGYFIGVEFTPDSRWSAREFRPRHLFDPRRLSPERQG